MKKLSLAVLIITLFTLFACQKNTVTENDTETSESIVEAENAESDGFTFALAGTDHQSKFGVLTSDSSNITSCFTASFTINSDGSITTVLTFNGTACPIDSIVRSGKIAITWFPGWRLGLTNHDLIIKYENFSRNGKVINGTVSVHFERFDTTYVPLIGDTVVVPSFTFTAKDMSIKFQDGTTFSWNGTRKVSFLRGYYTPFDPRDNIVMINANTSGTTRYGDSFTSVATNIIRVHRCPYHIPIAGVRTININNKETIIINYGNGKCDPYYTITKNGKTVTVDVTKKNG